MTAKGNYPKETTSTWMVYYFKHLYKLFRYEAEVPKLWVVTQKWVMIEYLEGQVQFWNIFYVFLE